MDLVCKTNHPNIAKKVIRNALATDIQLNPIPTTNKIYRIPGNVRSCSTPGCATCPLLWCRGAISGTATYYTKIKITQRLDCNSTNVIYVIQCTHCHRQYVGKTSVTLRNRTLHHRNKFFGSQTYRPLLYQIGKIRHREEYSVKCCIYLRMSLRHSTLTILVMCILLHGLVRNYTLKIATL